MLFRSLTEAYKSGTMDQKEYERALTEIHQFNNPTGNLLSWGSTPEANIKGFYETLKRAEDNQRALQGLPPDQGQSWEDYVKQFDDQKDASRTRRGRGPYGQ